MDFRDDMTIIIQEPLENDMEDTLTVSSPNDGFVNVPDKKGSPVPDEEVWRNIRDSFDFKFPVLEKSKEMKSGNFIFVGGGPTLLKFVDEIKSRSEAGEFICTSNHTNDFLIDNGIIPTMVFVLDPKEIVGSYIKKPDNRSIFAIATSCNKNVIQGLIEKGITNIVKVLIGYGTKDDQDIKIQKDLYPQDGSCYNVGGTMTPLRAMHLAMMLGYKTIEYYGFDSCFADVEPKLIFEGDARYNEIKKSFGGAYYTDPKTNTNYVLDGVAGGGFFYAYGKKRIENIQVAMTGDGRKFLTSPVFAHQAKQFKKWVDRYEGKLHFIVHGDSLTSHLLKLHVEKIAREKEEIGDRRWTEKYKEIQVELHKNEYADYGHRGSIDMDNIELLGRSIVAIYTKAKELPIKILDYGCGQGHLQKTLSKLFNAIEVTNYDPFVEEFSKEPEGIFDLVTVLDVMEHVEIQCVENTLKYLCDKTKFMILFSIAMIDAKKDLPDGRNAHVTQKNSGWWKDKIMKYFDIIEGFTDGAFVFLLCQSRDISQYAKREDAALIRREKEDEEEDQPKSLNPELEEYENRLLQNRQQAG